MIPYETCEKERRDMSGGFPEGMMEFLTGRRDEAGPPYPEQRGVTCYAVVPAI